LPGNDKTTVDQPVDIGISLVPGSRGVDQSFTKIWHGILLLQGDEARRGDLRD